MAVRSSRRRVTWAEGAQRDLFNALNVQRSLPGQPRVLISGGSALDYPEMVAAHQQRAALWEIGPIEVEPYALYLPQGSAERYDAHIARWQQYMREQFEATGIWPVHP